MTASSSTLVEITFQTLLTGFQKRARCFGTPERGIGGSDPIATGPFAGKRQILFVDESDVNGPGSKAESAGDHQFPPTSQ